MEKIVKSGFEYPACNSQPQHAKQKELELKEKELELKEMELQLLNANKEQKDLKSLYKELKKSIFTLYTKDNNGNIIQGTAFVIDETGIALSNYHVLENASAAIAINEAGEEYMINEIIDHSKDLDYVAFRLGPNNKRFDHLIITKENPEIGEECFAIGNPNGLTNTITKGIISAYRKADTIIQTDASYTHGSSGGPLFNQEGEVIGITSSGMEGADLNFALNIKALPLNKLYLETEKSIDEGKIIKNSSFSASAYVKRYFGLIEQEKYGEAIDMFDAKINRYYYKYKPTKDWVYHDMITYKTRSKINSVHMEIDYGSLKTYKAANGNFLIDFHMDYRIDRKEKNKPSEFKLKLFMEVNSEMRIVSLYEDIISKK